MAKVDLPGTEKRDARLARFTNSSINNSKDFEILSVVMIGLPLCVK